MPKPAPFQRDRAITTGSAQGRVWQDIEAGKVQVRDVVIDVGLVIEMQADDFVVTLLAPNNAIHRLAADQIVKAFGPLR